MNKRPMINTGDAYWQDENSYIDTPEFKDYAAMIEYIVHHSEAPVGTRQIHSILGEKAKREWTLDALESLSSVTIIEGLIDRWRPATGHATVHSKRWNGANMSWLFARTQTGGQFANLGVTEPSHNSF